jgi:hypothetical protein
MNSFKIGAIAILSEKVVKMTTQLAMLILLAHFLGPEELALKPMFAKNEFNE